MVVPPGGSMGGGGRGVLRGGRLALLRLPFLPACVFLRTNLRLRFTGGAVAHRRQLRPARIRPRRVVLLLPPPDGLCASPAQHIRQKNASLRLSRLPQGPGTRKAGVLRPPLHRPASGGRYVAVSGANSRRLSEPEQRIRGP